MTRHFPELEKVRKELGPTSPVQKCCNKYLPLFVVDGSRDVLRAATEGIDPEMVILTYRCQRCKSVKRITLADLGLTP